MPSTYTTSLKLTLPATGENSGTWGDLVNNGITTLIDRSIAGTTSIALTNAADYTLSVGDGSSPNESRYMFITATGALTSTWNVICPAVSKMYVFTNNTTGGYALTFKTSGGSGISVPNGKRIILYCDGTNVLDGFTHVNSLTLSTALPVASGGTGAATLTVNNVLLGNGTSALQVVAPGTTGNVLTSNGTTWSSSAPTAQVYPGAGVAVSTGTAWGTSKATPTGVIVGDTDTQTLTNKTVEAGTFTNGYTEETVTANTGTAYTIDLANGTVQILTLTGNCTFTYPTATAGRGFTLILKQDATGSRTVTWPATVKWPSSTAPTITSTASRSDKYVFVADGTNWIASNAGQNYTL